MTGTASASALAGVPDLSRLITRRERIRLPIWCYAILASVAGTAYSFKTLYATAESREQFADGIGKNPALAVLYGRPFDLTTIGGLTTWRMGVFGALLLAIMSIVTVNRHTRAEEEAGRFELVATKTGRLRWAAAHLAYPLLGSALLLVAAGAGAGLAHGARSGDLGAQLAQLIGAALIQVTAVWVVVGLTVAAFGLAPQATAYVGWIAVGICILFQELGPILGLSHWITDISPFAQVPRAPGVAIAAEPLLVMTAIAAVLLVLGLIGFRRRDVG
jgi:ABC-2 type transport system permease protein